MSDIRKIKFEVTIPDYDDGKFLVNVVADALESHAIFLRNQVLKTGVPETGEQNTGHGIIRWERLYND